MANGKKVAFRSALSGYNREDVHAYILELNRDFEEREKSTKESADSLASQLKEISVRADILQREKEEAETIIASLRESADQLKEENARLSEKLKEAESREEILHGQVDAAERESASLRGELMNRQQDTEISAKSLKYDQISSQIGDIMINANSSAEQIIATANSEAGRIMAETEEEAICIRTRLSDAADEMLSSISDRLHLSAENCLSELLASLREMRESADALLRDFEKRSLDLNEKIDYHHAGVTDAVSRSLREMDEKYGIRKK